jgi:preprotein translocase subunit SecA
MGKKKPASAAIKATGTKQDRSRAAAAANPVRTEDVKQPPKAPKAAAASSPAANSTPAEPGAPFRRPVSFNFAGVGRNDICPCGSGKRFKNCHGH